MVRFVLLEEHMRSTVTLVSNVDCPALSTYLTNVGFRVRRARSADPVGRSGALVWLDPADETTILETLRGWLRASLRTRVVIVTDRPTRIRTALIDLRGRVRVLPAPAFGWQVVDAIREDGGLQ